MAKKRRAKQKLSQKRQQQKAHRPAARLDGAEEALKTGNWVAAVAAAEQAIRSANDAATKQRAKTIAAEALFHQAAQKGVAEGLALLKQALTHAPEQARLHYHRALAEWRGGAVNVAVAALDAAQIAKERAPSDYAHLVYLQQLGNLAVGKKNDLQKLAPVEQTTLEFLAAIKKRGKKDALPELPDVPILGDPTIWSLLLQMYANTGSAPAVSFKKARDADPTMAANPVVTYYAGVVAMRQGNTDDAEEAWRVVGQQLHTPWLVTNLQLFRRERATALADRGEWQAVVDLYEATRREAPLDQTDAAFDEIAGYAYFHLGFAAGQQGKWDDAYLYFQSASALIKNRLLSQNVALSAEKVGNWIEAADAWREMVRRRPRKTDHPDYLSDAQIAAIWLRAMICYEKEDLPEEAITCAKNAIKYAETNIEVRNHLVDLYIAEERIDAAINELHRILEIDENQIPTLIRLATIYGTYGDGDPKPLWQRILTIDPNHEDARTGLALYYAERANMLNRGYGMFWDRAPRRQPKQQTAEKILLEGLADVPDHPVLLVELGKVYHQDNQFAKSRIQLARAIDVAPRNLMTLSVALHELLHAEGEEEIRAATPKIRQIQGLRPSFWVEQGEQALGCEFDAKWARYFWDIAVDVAEPCRGEDSQAAILLKIIDEANDMEETALVEHYAKVITARHPNSGGPEYVRALQLFEQAPEKKGPIRTQLRKAKANAQKANEPGILERIGELEEELEYGGMASLFGRGNPLADLADLFGEMGGLDLEDLDIDEEDLFDAFRRRFR